MLSAAVAYCIISSLLRNSVKIKRKIIVLDNDISFAHKITGNLIGDCDSRSKCPQRVHQAIALQFKWKQPLRKLLALHHGDLRLGRDGSSNRCDVPTPGCGYFFLQRLGLITNRGNLLPEIVMQFLADRTLVFFRYGNQCLFQTFALKPPLQITCDRVDEPLLFRYQEWLVLGIENTQLAAEFVVGVNLRLQFVRATLTVVIGSEAPAIEFDHGGSDFRELHGGYQVLKNLLAGIIHR